MNHATHTPFLFGAHGNHKALVAQCDHGILQNFVVAELAHQLFEGGLHFAAQPLRGAPDASQLFAGRGVHRPVGKNFPVEVLDQLTEIPHPAGEHVEPGERAFREQRAKVASCAGDLDERQDFARVERDAFDAQLVQYWTRVLEAGKTRARAFTQEIARLLCQLQSTLNFPQVSPRLEGGDPRPGDGAGEKSAQQPDNAGKLQNLAGKTIGNF